MRQSDLLALISKVGVTLLASATLNETLQQVVSLVFEAVPADRCLIMMRDEGGTGRPIITYDQCAGNVYQVTVACQNSTFRGDFLFSYQPNPGTVLFLGYGAGYADTRPLAQPFEFPNSIRFNGYNRTDDALFVKASYLFRL